MTSVPLDESSAITLDGSGNGTAKVGPQSSREVWHPANAHVSANTTPTNEAACVLMVGDVNSRKFRDNTFSGSSGDGSDKIGADVLKSGEYVWAFWTGGDPGAQARLTVTGTKDI